MPIIVVRQPGSAVSPSNFSISTIIAIVVGVLAFLVVFTALSIIVVSRLFKGRAPSSRADQPVRPLVLAPKTTVVTAPTLPQKHAPPIPPNITENGQTVPKLRPLSFLQGREGPREWPRPHRSRNNVENSVVNPIPMTQQPSPWQAHTSYLPSMISTPASEEGHDNVTPTIPNRFERDDIMRPSKLSSMTDRANVVVQSPPEGPKPAPVPRQTRELNI